MNFKQVGKMQKVEVQTELALLHTQQRQDEYMAIAYAKSHASDEDQKDDEQEEEKAVVAPIAAEVSSPPVAVEDGQEEQEEN